MKKRRALYLEVADKIKSDIFNEKYRVGCMLPTENELEAIFNVSKITVRKAIELLAADGYVEKKSGKGTTVLSNRPYNKLSKAVSFTKILQSSNYKIEKKILNIRDVSLMPNEKIYNYMGSHVLCLERLYLLDDKPYIYFVHYLSEDFMGISEEQFSNNSLYRLMNLKGHNLESFEDAFQAVFLTDKQKKILKTDVEIAIKRTRKSLDNYGKIIEYSEAIYDTDRHPYLIEYET